MITHPATVLAFAAPAWWAAKHFRSPAVRSWQLSELPRQMAGVLHCRFDNSTNPNAPLTILLHGLIATGDIFGAHFDQLATTGPLLVPDLLGFGRSLDAKRCDFGPEAHLDALDEALDELGLGSRPIRIGAHSMGSAVGLRWLERRAGQVTSITCFGPPIYQTADAVNATIAESGLMARMFVANTTWAQAACNINCSHRSLAGLAAAVVSPDLPVPVARAASLHTWPAYRDAMEELVSNTRWAQLIGLAADLDIPVAALWGSGDTIGDQKYSSRLEHLESVFVPHAGHQLPLTHAPTCVQRLASAP